VQKPAETFSMSTTEKADADKAAPQNSFTLGGFGAKKDEPAPPAVEVVEESTEKSTVPVTPVVSGKPTAEEAVSEEPVKKAEIEEPPVERDARAEYNRYVEALNTGVIQWIQDHVDKVPTCDLTPVFKDYMKHIKDIEKKYPIHEDDSEKSLEKESETLLSQPKVPAEPIVIAEDQQKEVEKPKLDTASVFSPKEKPAAAKPAFTGFFAAENKKEDEKEPAPAFKGFFLNKKPETDTSTQEVKPALFGGFGLNKKSESDIISEKSVFKGFGLNKPADSDNKPSIFKGFGNLSQNNDKPAAFGGFSFNKTPAPATTDSNADATPVETSLTKKKRTRLGFLCCQGPDLKQIAQNIYLGLPV